MAGDGGTKAVVAALLADTGASSIYLEPDIYRDDHQAPERPVPPPPAGH